MATCTETLDRADSGDDRLHRLEENLGPRRNFQNLAEIAMGFSKIEVQAERLPEAALTMIGHRGRPVRNRSDW